MKFFNFLFILIITGCILKHPSSIGNKFVNYKYNSKHGMRLDSVVIKDKSFDLQIPMGLLQTQTTVSYYFLCTLNFNDGQKIAFLYFPLRKESSNYKSSNISWRKFKNLCEKENITEELAEINKDKRRYFGVSKINNGNIYIIYLNIKHYDLNTFNYSINSLKL